MQALSMTEGHSKPAIKTSLDPNPDSQFIAGI